MEEEHNKKNGPNVFRIGFLSILLIRKCFMAGFLVLFNSVPVFGLTGCLISHILSVFLNLYVRPFKNIMVTIHVVLSEIFISLIILCGFRLNSFKNNAD